MRVLRLETCAVREHPRPDGHERQVQRCNAQRQPPVAQPEPGLSRAPSEGEQKDRGWDHEPEHALRAEPPRPRAKRRVLEAERVVERGLVKPPASNLEVDQHQKGGSDEHDSRAACVRR